MQVPDDLPNMSVVLPSIDPTLYGAFEVILTYCILLQYLYKAVQIQSVQICTDTPTVSMENLAAISDPQVQPNEQNDQFHLFIQYQWEKLFILRKFINIWQVLYNSTIVPVYLQVLIAFIISFCILGN